MHSKRGHHIFENGTDMTSLILVIQNGMPRLDCLLRAHVNKNDNIYVNRLNPY